MATDSLTHVRAAYEEIARFILRANRLAARCPEVRALLTELDTGRADQLQLDPAAAASMRQTSAAYLRVLDAAGTSPFAKMAQSPAIVAALKRPVT